MENKNNVSIEKPWAVYGGLTGCCMIGYVVKTSQNKLFLQTCENQQYLLEEREFREVTTFKTSQELIDYFFNNQLLSDNNYSKRDLTILIHSHFPTAMKQESLQSLHDTLAAYQKNLLAQTSPKCTPPIPQRRIDSMEPGYSEAND
jgi:hypothetical protein